MRHATAAPPRSGAVGIGPQLAGRPTPARAKHRQPTAGRHAASDRRGSARSIAASASSRAWLVAGDRLQARAQLGRRSAATPCGRPAGLQRAPAQQDQRDPAPQAIRSDGPQRRRREPTRTATAMARRTATRSTTADRASITSKIRGTTWRPTGLRTAGGDVDERPPARLRRAPAARRSPVGDRAPGRAPRPRRPSPGTRPAPIGVIGRCMPCATLTLKYTRSCSPRPARRGRQRVEGGDRPRLGEPQRARRRRSPTRCPAARRSAPRPGRPARPARHLPSVRQTSAGTVGRAAAAAACACRRSADVRRRPESVRVDRPGDDRLAQARGGVDHRLRAGRPVTGSAVNSTPAAGASTIRCTTTASRTRRVRRCPRRRGRPPPGRSTATPSTGAPRRARRRRRPR